jgi:tetratricopeptide (TPR) repeat protein
MANLKYLPLYAALAFAPGCAQHGARPPQPTVAASASAAPDTVPETDGEEVVDAVEAAPEVDLPKLALTPDILFKFLIAEVATQRGATAVASATYLNLAQETRDPRIARRAAEVAFLARDRAAALEATRLWSAAEPDSDRARQALAAMLLNEGRLDEAEPILREMLAQSPASGFMHLTALMGKLRDGAAMLAFVERLAADHPGVAEARYAVAQAAGNTGHTEAALVALEQADRLRPGWEPAALLRAQLIGKASPTDALAFMRLFLGTYPEARDLRLAFARALTNANQFAEARTQFERLASELPRNAEVSFAAGLLALQMGEPEPAREWLTRALDANPRDRDTLHYYLGQAAEQSRQPELAAKHYADVTGGNYLVAARARQAALLVTADRRAEARALLAATQGENDAQNVRLIQAQAELLRGDSEKQAVFDLLSEALKRFPDSAELLYDRAMAAEKLGRLDVLEADLRRVMHLRPDDAHAYNALGYTLADRTERLSEAIELLDRALKISPDDPFILDSVGWAQYRAGNLARAQEFLERAYEARPDPEIAAHLGEVLWARGRQEEAGKLWQSSLQSHPQNEVLLETLRRLKP